MSQFNTVEELLNFAMQEEQNAYQWYTDLAAKQTNESMRAVFEKFANEELGHKAKLANIKAGKYWKVPEGKILDLKISDYAVDVTPSADLDYQEALILAMKKEKAAFKLYNDLAASVDDDDLKETLLALAQEEAKHKLRFEVEYDEYVYQEN